MNTEYICDDFLSSVEFEKFDSSVSDEAFWNKKGVRNTFDDDYYAKKTVFPDGQIEVSITKGRHFNGSAITKPRAKRGESEKLEQNQADSGKEAKKRVRQACKTIGADRLVTLTYRENQQDRDVALKHWKAFCRRLRKCQDFRYVAVMELQERGAIHFHVAVRGRQCYQLLRSIWQGVVGLDQTGRKMAQVNVRDPHRFGFGKDGVHKLASYIAKYCTKSMQCREINQKRFFTSRGLPPPDTQAWRLPAENWLQAVQAAFRLVEEGTLNGLVVSNNNALESIWIATPPCSVLDYSCPF